MDKNKTDRRNFLKHSGLYSTGLVLAGAHSFSGTPGPGVKRKFSNSIQEAVYQTPMVDAHEHFYTEKLRLSGEPMISGQCNDWTILLNHYLNSDMIVSGMPKDDYEKFFSPDIDPYDKWQYLAGTWEQVKYLGSAQAVKFTIKELFDIDDITASAVPKLQEAYEKLLKPGFYKRVLQQTSANIESCQVDPLSGYPVIKSEYPDFIMSDLKANNFINSPGDQVLSDEAGIDPADLGDWHRVIDFWFEKYGKYVVGIKISLAYSRRIDFEPTEADAVEATCIKVMQGQKVEDVNKKELEDHLFWYVVDKATEYNLPVKMHLGYLAGNNRMLLEDVMKNPGDASKICKHGTDARFVFFHIAYPYYEEMLALAKHYENAYIDMCWSWIVNSISAREFLKKFIVTVPFNKLIVFGGDYRAAESTVGHAMLTRNGIIRALEDLVDENFITEPEALKIVEPLLRGNCHQIYDLKSKANLLRNLDWNMI
jgi:predicted TIM-barrel fold metal-dependent hydrolase